MGLKPRKNAKVYSNTSFLVSSGFSPDHINYSPITSVNFFLMQTLCKQRYPEEHKFKVYCNISLILSSGISPDRMNYPRIISVHFFYSSNLFRFRRPKFVEQNINASVLPIS